MRREVRWLLLCLHLSEALGHKPGASPGSGPPTTSTGSNNRSSCSNNKSSICVSNSKNATKDSKPPETPTANSWPASTP